MTEPMTPLRRRMIDDMRHMSPLTQGAYVRAVKNVVGNKRKGRQMRRGNNYKKGRDYGPK